LTWTLSGWGKGDFAVTAGLQLVKTYLKNQPHREGQRIINPMSKRLYTLKEAANYLGRGVWGLRELVWDGKIPVIKNDDRPKCKWFFDVHDLDDFIKSNKIFYN
jgi:hypothetical protein